MGLGISKPGRNINIFLILYNLCDSFVYTGSHRTNEAPASTASAARLPRSAPQLPVPPQQQQQTRRLEVRGTSDICACVFEIRICTINSVGVNDLHLF